jgi:prepilin-type N-terminal cleavage/methylation domain-containing protein
MQTSRVGRRTDAGFTLIELMVSIVAIGAIAVVIAASVSVTLRQSSDTNGRVDSARWSQSLALVLPNDLTSADPDLMSAPMPSARPSGCAASLNDDVTSCAFGSNALTMQWTDGGITTTVSYRYGRPAGETDFVLTRVECVGSSCTSRVILRDLDFPRDPSDTTPPLDPDPSWAAGSPIPTSVVEVNVPPGGDAPTVTFHVNGLPTPDGTERSSTVTVTAGGQPRSTLPPATLPVPNFVTATSSCGGAVTLVVDESGSIGDGIEEIQVREGVESFVRAFEGTPTTLQVVTFNSGSDVLDVSGSSSWNRFFDLSNPSDVFELVGDATLGSGGYLSQIESGGSTNWEAALYHTFYRNDGVPYITANDASAPHPELVVMFTDGVPTVNVGTAMTVPVPYNVGSAASGAVSPRAWWRANVIADEFRDSTRFIGVLAGPAAGGNSTQLPAAWPTPIPNRVFLGDLVKGSSDPASYDGSDYFNTVSYDTGTNSWPPVGTAHVLSTSDFGALGDGLAAIALESCGGTLTMQTRTAGGAPVSEEVTYTLGAEQVTTSVIARAATFDVSLGALAEKAVEVVPVADALYTAQSWSCRAGGADLVQGSDWSLITPGNPADGISVKVRADRAASCTMTVTLP